MSTYFELLLSQKIIFNKLKTNCISYLKRAVETTGKFNFIFMSKNTITFSISTL